MYDAVVFDDDGVLVTVCAFPAFREAARRPFEGLGIDPEPTEVAAVSGAADPKRIYEICGRHGLDPDAFWRRRDREAALAQRIGPPRGARGGRRLGVPPAGPPRRRRTVGRADPRALDAVRPPGRVRTSAD